ncbi:MAG TPA: hypothetical protein VFE37_01215 [Chloroflexota bacterium]|nr:hypothetical protein [Chloroflexota bacterium]
MRRLRDPDSNGSEAPGGRWQRRARRAAAERRRMPKHGKAYVRLVERMLAKRAEESAATSAPGARRAKRPHARPASA